MTLFEFLKTLGYNNQEAKDTIIAFMFGLDLTRKQIVDIQAYIK